MHSGVLNAHNGVRRAPDTSGYNYWTNKDATSSTGLLQLIKTIRTGSSYANRF